MSRRIAVVLMNLGGPDGPEAVRPFLQNLFDDPAIIGLPSIVRRPLARTIAKRREAAAKANYAIMGGRSPLLPETEKQAEALRVRLATVLLGDEILVTIAMRYWRPFTQDAARAVEAFAPDDVILLPLYPQFSTTTTGSSVKDWRAAYKGPGRTRTVCCYPDAEGVAAAHAAEIRKVWDAAGSPGNVRLLFSAHGLPQQVIDGGDPYQAQIEATAAATAALLPELTDWRVCYQSRVGRLKWLEPSTETAILAAGQDGKGVIVSPIAFVSEHVETLVELDHEYADLARTHGVQPYLRARTPGVQPAFIGELARAVTDALPRTGAAPHGPWRCRATYGKCLCAQGNTP